MYIHMIHQRLNKIKYEITIYQRFEKQQQNFVHKNVNQGCNYFRRSETSVQITQTLHDKSILV